MIILNLKQWDDPLAQDNAIEILCNRVMRLGFDYDYFIAFGPAFFCGLRTVSGNNYSLDIERSWKNVYSSVLAVTIPHLLRTGGDKFPTTLKTGGFTSIDELAAPTVEHNQLPLTLPVQTPQNDPNRSSCRRLYTTPYNFIDLND